MWAGCKAEGAGEASMHRYGCRCCRACRVLHTRSAAAHAATLIPFSLAHLVLLVPQPVQVRCIQVEAVDLQTAGQDRGCR